MGEAFPSSTFWSTPLFRASEKAVVGPWRIIRFKALKPGLRLNLGCKTCHRGFLEAGMDL